jgi:gliding motility-associated-like protein
LLRSGLQLWMMVWCMSLTAQPIPRLDWATYHGGTGEDVFRDMTIDKTGHLYVVGSTQSAAGIATAGSFQNTLAGMSDVYVAKYTTDGTLVWSTYFGGQFDDFGQSIALDTQGNIFITGITSSMTGIASPGAFQNSNNGGFADAFVAKFDTDGNRIWSTYFGGNMDERSNSITVDGDGNVTIIGWTNSNSSIASPGAFQTTFQGQEDIYLAQFDNNGLRRWATYYGDTGYDIGLQIDADASNNLVISGWTSSTANFTTAVAFQTVYGGGTADAYIARFSQNGTRLWCTYYGGSFDEYGDALLVAENGDIYLAGPCNSPDALSTPGTHQPVIGGGFDAFVARFNASGSRTWGSFYGGPNDDVAYGLALDEEQNLYLTGYTRSASAIATVNAHQTTPGGDWDAYLVRLTNMGMRQWATYLGGSGLDQSLAVEADSSGYVYISGLTVSQNQITTPGSTQETYGGGTSDGFVARFSPCTDPVLTFLNGGYLCDGSDFVFDFEITGVPPFQITYSLDGVIQPPIVADTSPFFYTVIQPWTDSIKLLSVTSGPCTGQITGAFDYVKKVEPVTSSNVVIDCNQNDFTYTVSLDLTGGVFSFLSVGSTPGFINVDHFISSPLPFAQDFDIAITSGLMCDTLLITGPSGCTVNCPIDFGTIIPDTLVCDGSDILLQASGGISYAWQGPDNFTSNQPNPVITGAGILNQGVYTVIVTDVNSCRDTLTTQVEVHVVQGSIMGDTSVCAGENIQLFASGGLTYQWSGPDNYTSIIQNPTIVNPSILQDGNYFVTITDQENCSVILSIDIVVHPLPDATASGNGPLCEGEALLLSAGGGNAYSWQGPSGFLSNQQNPSLINTGINNSGMYSVTVRDQNNCMDTDSVNVIILDAPDIMLTSNSPVCSGSDILLQGSGADGYSWSGPNGFTSSLPDPIIMNGELSDSGLYSLIGFNANGCRDTLTEMIDVFPLPVVMVASDKPEYCEGDTLHLQVNQASTYSWSGPIGFNSTLQSPSILNITTLQQGTYSIEISDANGCTNEAQLNILVHSSPVTTISGDLALCEGDTLQLSAQGNGTSYAWTGPAAFMSSGAQLILPAVSLVNSGTYYLTSANAQNCISLDSVIIMVQVNPVAVINGPDTICEGEEVLLTASGGQQYQWDNGQIGAVMIDFPDVSGGYEVTVFEGECSNIATWNVIVNQLPQIMVGGATTISSGESITLSATGADQYIWDPVDGLSCTACPDPVATPDSTTTYCVTGILNGCEAIECVVLNVIIDCDFDLPNVFSPNFDGSNDFWCSTKPDCVMDQTLTVFDRWGNALFIQSGEEVCWDGTSRNKEVNSGVYVFLLELRLSATETKYKTGDILLLR